MAQDFGNGVSRTLSALQRQFQLVVWQASKPPLDSELNLMSQVDMERLANVVRAEMHSGFLLDPVDALSDYGFSSNWSNFFKLGNPVAAGESPPVWANVNGWLIPVTGTAVADGDSSNRVDLYGPPSTDNRIDFVFLEVWQAQVGPNPSTENKPSAGFIWKYGNTKFGGTNMADQMEDPTIGFETTERLQLQYRIRTFGSGVGLGESLDLATYPNGLDDPNVLGQGGATTPVAYGWHNMGEELGDPGLWRAGNGDATNDLKTVNGYTYAIPICAVFRRNSSTYVSVISAGNARQNGGLDRNPTTATVTDPSEATRIFTGVTLTNALAAPTPVDSTIGTGAVQVEGMANSGFDNSDINWNSTFLMLGDEVFSISAVDTSTVPATITIRDGSALQGGGRGRAGTQSVSHDAGTPIAFYNFRPDGFFSDEIAPQDILDQRRGVTLGEWDYDQILTHNLGSLFGNDLRSSYKQNPTTAGDTEGTVITEVDYLCGDAGVTVAQTEALDGPDGIRTVFSDAAVAQSDVTILLAPGVGTGTNSNYVSGASWDVAADFVPDGFQTVAGWGNGTIIDLHIGGASGTGGARATVRGDFKNVRFLPPYEYWRDESTWYRNNHNGRQTPITLRFMGEYATEPSGVDGTAGTEHPGPMFPLVENNFEYPFIFLGGHLSDDLVSPSAAAYSIASAGGTYPEVRFAGLNFDSVGVWWNGTDVTSSNLTGIAKLLFHGDYNLFDLLTDFGKDRSGSSSRVYLVLKGDTSDLGNNGVFRVIGAGDGTAGYTHCNAMDPSGLVVEFMGADPLPAADFVNPATPTPVTLTAEARSQYTSVKDGNGTSGTSSATIVITDITGTRGGQGNPWNALNATGYPITSPVAGDCVANFVLQYGPSRGGTARVANRIDRFALVSPPASNALLRQSIRSLDEAANSTTVAPISGVGPRSSEIYYPLESLQTWNRLPGLGLHAPEAPNYGGDKFAVFTEQDRDCELFVDPGSKTVIFRPYRKIDMKLPGYDVSVEGVLMPANYAPLFAGINTDSASILLAGNHDDGFAVPPEYMPRFGRQDIPVYVDIADPPGTGTFLSGINHLFVDGTDTAADNTAIIGGTDNAGAAAINNFFIQTGATSTLDYGAYGPILAGVGGGNAIQGRLLENGFGDVNVRSSDLEGHLEGIELPPFLGVARVYGVYDARDWQGDASTAWEADRITPQVGASIPPNLIRTHADKQTLFIVQGGGEDLTQDADDHTYVIPSNVIDITKSAHFTAGETFSDLEYIVQCSVFYFARGFINKNNYVLVRGHNGAGVVGSIATPLTNVAMVAPAPATYPTQAYVAYDRTVYQGDPYMSRYGDTRVVSDYGMNYGVIQQTNAFLLEDPIQQYLLDAKVPEIPNPRALEVLASVDFWTTMGTGKMGGRVYAGTPSDVGYLNSSTRIPATGTADTNPWPTSPRVFTEGQPQTAPRAVAAITITNFASLAGEGVEIKRAGITSIAGTTSLSATFTADTASWALGLTATEAATNLATAINGYGPTPEWAPWGGMGITAKPRGETVYIESAFPGSEGNDTLVSLLPVSPNPAALAMYLHKPPLPSSIGFAGDYGRYFSRGASLPMSGGADLVVNGSWGNAYTPSKYTGLTERLPLGILLQDCDFIGEDPLRDGQSALFSKVSVNDLAMSREEPYVSGGPRGGVVPAARLGGTAVGSQMGMADGAILTWPPYNSGTGLGTKRFRLFRGASSYVLSPHAGEGGGPVDWALGGLDESETPMLKGAVLLGRALLVRNYKEEVFAAADTVSYGDEIQMVVLTRGILGEGQACENGYLLDGAISPSGYGKGYSASDRYRLEGKPFITTHTKQGLDPDVEIVAYPSIDPTEDPCP